MKFFFETIRLGILVCCLGVWASIAFGGADSSNLTSIEVVKEAQKNQTLSFKFEVKIPTDLVFNGEGPWKLKLKKHDGLSFEKTEWGAKDVDSNIPGFLIVTNQKPQSKAGLLEYSLTAFVCSKDKSKCYREVHNGTTNW